LPHWQSRSLPRVNKPQLFFKKKIRVFFKQKELYKVVVFLNQKLLILGKIEGKIYKIISTTNYILKNFYLGLVGFEPTFLPL
jgi:hypothetical protein